MPVKKEYRMPDHPVRKASIERFVVDEEDLIIEPKKPVKGKEKGA